MSRKDNRSIHVLHVVPGLGPGGMELAMARVITALTGPEMRHSIACLKGEAEIATHLPDETGIHCFHSRPNEPQLPARLGRLIRQIRPTVIHARNWGAWPDVTVGRLLAWPIVPLIYSFHGLGRAGYMPLRRRLASRILVKMTTHLFTVSEQSRRMLVAHWSWPDGKVGVIPNGVDTVLYTPGRARRARKRLVVGTVGNLRPVKNHALLIRSAANLVARSVNLEIRIAGEGDERTSLEELAGSLGIANRVQLIGYAEDIPAFLRKLDIFVLSSDSEQHPNALIEAMSSGLPCVATRVGSVDEVLDSGRCGRIVEPGDLNGLSDAIMDLAGDRELRSRLASAGREQVCEKYSLERMIPAYSEMYERLSIVRTH